MVENYGTGSSWRAHHLPRLWSTRSPCRHVRSAVQQRSGCMCRIDTIQPGACNSCDPGNTRRSFLNGFAGERGHEGKFDVLACFTSGFRLKKKRSWLTLVVYLEMSSQSLSLGIGIEGKKGHLGWYMGFATGVAFASIFPKTKKDIATGIYLWINMLSVGILARIGARLGVSIARNIYSCEDPQTALGEVQMLRKKRCD